MHGIYVYGTQIRTERRICLVYKAILFGQDALRHSLLAPMKLEPRGMALIPESVVQRKGMVALLVLMMGIQMAWLVEGFVEFWVECAR